MWTFLNWAAPALFSSKIQTIQAEISGSIVNRAPSQNLGVCLTPVFGYKRGFVWKQEHMAKQLLANSNLNIDRTLALVFQRYDARLDRRAE